MPQVPSLQQRLHCTVCGANIDVTGQWDDEGRPWALPQASVWVSVDAHGRAAFRCRRCEPRGKPLVLGLR